MRRKRFSVEQMVAVLKQAEVGVPVAEVCRQVGITEQTFYRWKKRYVGLDIDRLRAQRATPKMLFCDNGTEFTSQAMDLWAYHAGVQIDFSRPGKPTDNA